MAAKKSFHCASKVILWPGEMGAWHFAGIPKEVSTAIKTAYQKPRRGFGAVPVMVTIGSTTWQTSIFPDSRSGCYILPLKAKVRTEENIFADDTVALTLTLR